MNKKDCNNYNKLDADDFKISEHFENLEIETVDKYTSEDCW